MSRLKVPVLLLTGYLGSGKTTLLNRILVNKKGIKFAVIVNDIGEVNVDASLIQRGGVVGAKDDSLVALQNGCICCTLKMDLVKQINDLTSSGIFDYIVIEASGICEPAPIAQTICSIPQLTPAFVVNDLGYLDCIVSVVDALRLKSEFNCGDSLSSAEIEDEDIENLIIQQIEFCNIILLNKASEVSDDELKRIKAIVRTIQPEAEIIECDYCDIDLDRLLHTGRFNFDRTATSAAWIRELEYGGNHDEDDEDDEDHDEHEGHHGDGHHHHHDGEGEVEEYGISTFVYYRRRPFDMNRFDRFVEKQWDNGIIRSKGICWFDDDYDMSYIFEQAGVQKKLTQCGNWYATAPADDLLKLMEEDDSLMQDWDPIVGDRMQRIVFIGRNMDKDRIVSCLDSCLVGIAAYSKREEGEIA